MRFDKFVYRQVIQFYEKFSSCFRHKITLLLHRK